MKQAITKMFAFPYLLQHYSQQPRYGKPKYPLTLEWVKRMYIYVCVCIYIYVYINYSAMKNTGNLAICNNIGGLWGHCVKWNKKILHSIIYMFHFLNIKLIKTRSEKLPGAGRGGTQRELGKRCYTTPAARWEIGGPTIKHEDCGLPVMALVDST